MPVDLQQAKQQYERLQSAQYDGSITYLKWEEGPNVIRILPPYGERKTAWLEFKKSFGVGPNQKPCVPRFDHTCPLKKEIDRLSSTGNEDDKKRATGMYPKTRVALWVVVRAPHKQAGEGPILLDTNTQVLRDILAIFADPDYGDISDPVSGLDITVNFTPKEKTLNGFPAWQITPKRHSSHLGTPEEIAEWTSEDLFEKYHLGKPSEDGWINAILEGTEEEYLKTLRDGSGGSQQQSALPPQTQAATPSATPPASPPPAQAAPPPVMKLVVPDPTAKYWAVDPNSNTTVEMSALVVGAYFEKGIDLTMMTYDQSSGWTKASALGFKLEASMPSPPPAPTAPAPPAAPSAPPPPSVSSDADAALRAKIEAARAAKANGQSSQVAQDVKSQLG